MQSVFLNKRGENMISKKRYYKFFVLTIMAVMLISIVIFAGCESEEKPIDKIYTGTYNYFPENSWDMGAGSRLYLRQTEVCVDQLYCDSITLNGKTEYGVVIGSSNYKYFTYSTSSFTIDSNTYTTTVSPYSHTLSLSGTMGLYDFSVNGKTYAGVPTIKMYGTQLILSGIIPD